MTKPVLSSFGTIAPLMIHQYEKYLPTAFSHELSLLQKVNMVIKKLDEIGLVTNALIEQWNEVMEWVMGEGLTDAVSDKLDQMYADGLFDSLIRALFTEEFTFTSLKHNVYLGAMLDIPDIMQSVRYDKVNKCLYVAYEDQHKRFVTPTLILAKLDLTGKLVGEMFFTNFGHGDGFSIDTTNNENIVLNLVNGGIYKTIRTAFSKGATFTDFTQLTVLTAFNGRDWKMSFNEDLSVFVLVDAVQGDKIYVYKQNLFLLTTLPVTPDLTINLPTNAKPYQGIAVGKESIYYSSGIDSTQPNANDYPQMLREYKISDGSFVQNKYYSEFASSYSANGYSEPEGIQLVVDEFGAETLLVGYVHGEFRQRMNDIYEFASKGVSPITRRIVRGFYKENGTVKSLIDDPTFYLSGIYEGGAYYVENAADTPTGRKGFFKVDVSWNGVDILQTFISNANITYKRWLYWTNSTKTVTDWVDDKTGVNFVRETPVNATFMTGVANGSGFFPQLFTYRESFPVGARAYIGGTFSIDSAVLDITGGQWKKIATVTHKPFEKVPLVITSFSAGINNTMGYIDIDGSVYIQGSGATTGYYTVGEQSYRIAAS